MMMTKSIIVISAGRGEQMKKETTRFNQPTDRSVANSAELNAAISDANQLQSGLTLNIWIGKDLTLSEDIAPVNTAGTVTVAPVSGMNSVRLDGGGTYRGFVVISGTMNLNDMSICNMVTRGPAGGLGAGGGLFVASVADARLTGDDGKPVNPYHPAGEASAVTLRNVSFSGCQAYGGHGAVLPVLGGSGGPGCSFWDDKLGPPPPASTGVEGTGPWHAMTESSYGVVLGSGCFGMSGIGGAGGLGGSGGAIQWWQDGPAPDGVQGWPGGTGEGGGYGAAGGPGGGGGGGGGGGADLTADQWGSYDQQSGGAGGPGGAGGGCGVPGFGGGGDPASTVPSQQGQPGAAPTSSAVDGSFAGRGGTGGTGAPVGAGAGFGGAVFVMDSAGLTLMGSGEISGGQAVGGTADTPGPSGAGAGAGIFQQGSGALMVVPDQDATYTISDPLVDESGAVANGLVPPSSRGAGADGLLAGGGGVWSLEINGEGTLALTGPHAFAGVIRVNLGALDLSGYANAAANDLYLGAATSLVRRSAAGSKPLTFRDITVDQGGATLALNGYARITAASLSAPGGVTIAVDPDGFQPATPVTVLSTAQPMSPRPDVTVSPGYQVSVSSTDITVTKND